MKTENQIKEKIFTIPDLMVKVDFWKEKGEKIVFTNGCFDLLHPGHVFLLSRASFLGDRLIVGLNSDQSVRGLKGPDRPLEKQEDRAFMLAALSSVSAVVIFDEPTPANLIEKLTPDVLVKGGDYRKTEIVGAGWVTTHGGQVVIIPLLKGYSTTEIIKKLMEKHRN